jgi:hypothetical protein
LGKTAEDTFEELCCSHGLGCDRIPTAEANGEQRPDYRVLGQDSSSFLAEIKQVTPSAAERREIDRILGGEIFARSITPGARVRELIAKANPQLRALAQGRTPGALVIFNLDPFLRHHTDPYAILTAMRGLDVVPVLVPRNPNQSPIFQPVRSGPKKRMTAQANTSISAIVLPYQTQEQTWAMDVFHNRHAACRLPRTALVGSWARHWRLRDDEREWEPYA